VPLLDDTLTQPVEIILDESDRTPMATQSFTTDDERVEGLLPIDRPQAGLVPNHRYQLNVVASHIVDVVRSAGGWLCDRARAGWDVNVLVADHHDPLPLTILGATTHDLGAEFSSMVRKASRGGALAVSAELLATDDRVRSEVLRILRRGFTEVTLWGDEWPSELGRKVDPTPRRMSSAGRAFKTHALGVAAGSTDAITPTETLFRIGTGSFRPLYSV
jgi:hypothetical protein